MESVTYVPPKVLPMSLRYTAVGYTLYKIQEGFTPSNTKPLAGIKPAVKEIVVDHDSNTFRAVYTIKIDDIVYVLHCFQKKSKKGIKTPKQEVDLIKQRLNEAIEISKLEGA